MSSNFSDFRIETKDGKILNVSELCNAIKSTKIEEEDIPFLETLCNKLAYDDYRDNEYTNEYKIVDVLHEVLLKYYIDNNGLGLDEVIEVLKVYNKEFNNIHKLSFNNTYYLLFDNRDNIRLLSFKSEDDMLKNIYNNISLFIRNNIKIIFDQAFKGVKELELTISHDKDLMELNETFSLSDKVYEGKDINNNTLYNIKNGLYVKDNGELLTLYTPTLNEFNRTDNHRIKDGFDLDEFYILTDKFKKNEYMEKEDIDKLYYEVRYLINTMQRRKKDDELSEALDEYMKDILQIYDNYPEGLSKEDKKNVIDYRKNVKNNYRKAA